MSHGGCEGPPQAPDLVPARAKHWEARGTKRGVGQTVSAPQRKGCVTHLSTRLLRAQVTPPPVPSPLTTRRQDRGQGGGLSFILRPQRVETEEAATVFPACVPGRGWMGGKVGRWCGQAEGWGSLAGQHGLGGFPASSTNSQLPQAKQGSVAGRDRQLGAGVGGTRGLSVHIPSSQGSRLSELWGPQASPPLCLPAFTLAASAPRKACSATLQSPTLRPLLPEALPDVLSPKAPARGLPQPDPTTALVLPRAHCPPLAGFSRVPGLPLRALGRPAGTGDRVVVAARTQAFRLLPGASCVLRPLSSGSSHPRKTYDQQIDRAGQREGPRHQAWHTRARSVAGTGRAGRKVSSRQTRLKSREKDLA